MSTEKLFFVTFCGYLIAGFRLKPGLQTSLGQSVDSSYNQSQMQALLDKMDELIIALRA